MSDLFTITGEGDTPTFKPGDWLVRDRRFYNCGFVAVAKPLQECATWQAHFQLWKTNPLNEECEYLRDHCSMLRDNLHNLQMRIKESLLILEYGHPLKAEELLQQALAASEQYS